MSYITGSIPIGDVAQAGISKVLASLGGHVFLDDGRCSGWFDVPGRGSDSNMWNARGSTTISPLKAAPGSICQFADAINKGAYSPIELVVQNGGWQGLLRGNRPLIVKLPQITTPKGIAYIQQPWNVRARAAIRNVAAYSPGPSVTAFSPLAGLNLPNTYRSR